MRVMNNLLLPSETVECIVSFILDKLAVIPLIDEGTQLWISGKCSFVSNVHFSNSLLDEGRRQREMK